MRQSEPNEQLSLSHVTENATSMSSISLRSASLTQLFLKDLAIIPQFQLAEPTKFVFGSTLAPWPNRLEDGSYSHAGKQHRFSELDAQNNKNHGLVLDRDFEIRQQSNDSIALGYRFGLDNAYPFDVDLEIRYQLGEELLVEAIATNHGDAAPFAIGFHPYFLTGPEFQLNAGFTHRGVSDERMLPIAIDPIPGLDLNQDSVELETLDHCFMGSKEVRLMRPEGGFSIKTLENLPYFMLYRPKEKFFESGGAIAIEPMSAPANIFRNDIASVILEKGEQKRYAFEVRKL